LIGNLTDEILAALRKASNAEQEAELRGFKRGLEKAVEYLAQDKRDTLTKYDLGEIANAILELRDCP
jgi:hypothetical protein